MAKRSLHIGLNYENSPYELPDCDLDSVEMQRRARAQGYRTSLQNGIYTADEFLADLVSLRENSTKTGTALITYSGHGTQWHDRDSQEPDKQEEALCFWNGTEIEVFSDDNLRTLLGEFKGTVIVVLDSCFSGGMERVSNPPPSNMKKRFVPFDPNWKAAKAQPSFSRAVSAVGNKLYYVFASKEDEVSWSTGQGGLFTKAFCAAYDQSFGKHRTISRLTTAARKSCAGEQTPNFFSYGGSASKRLL